MVMDTIVADLTELVSSPKAFEAWLKKQDPDEVLGEKDSVTCPFWAFLVDNRVETPTVTTDTVEFTCDDKDDDSTVVIEHEPWLYDFINRMDRTRTPLTAKKLLSLLNTSLKTTET